MKKIVLILVLFFTLLSCKVRERIVEVEKEVVKTEYKTNHIRDSIFHRDSIFLEKRNDTVFLTKNRYIYKDKLRIDTLLRTDTISNIRVEFVEVNKLTKWQEWRLKLFRWLVVSVIILLLYSFRKILLKIIHKLFI